MGWAVAPLVSLAISTGAQLLLGLFKKSPKQKDPSLQVPKSDYGVGIPKIYGRVRLEGNKFFPQTTNLMYKVVNEQSSGGGGKGGGRSRTINEKKVYGTIALLYCQGKTILEKIIIQGEHIETNHPFYQQYATWFDGTQDNVWSVVAQDEEPYRYIKYKDVAYLGIHELPLDRYGNQIPTQISAVLVDGVFGAQPTLDKVVGDILTRAGIDGSLWDVTDLSQIILRDGIVVRQSGESYREAIESLMELYLFAPYQDNDGKIIFRRIRRGDSSVVSLDNRYFVENEDGGSYISEIKSDFELPTKLSIKFFNNSRVYEQDEVNVYLGNKSESENNVKSVSETLYTYPYEAEERAREILSYFYSIEKNSFKFKLPIYYYSQFNCLDVVTLPNGQTVQITKINIGADYTVEITATYYDSIDSNYVSTPDTAIIPPVLTDPPIPQIFILDVPVVNNDLPGSLYCFATSGPATIEFSDNGGASWSYATNHLYASVIGECTDIIGSSVTVNVISGGGLESITQGEFDVEMGQNLCLIGREMAGGYYEGEFVQFRDAVLVGSNQYTLSMFKRGLNNTGSYQHVSGEKLFLFKGVGSYYSIILGNASFLGLNLLFRAIVSDWQNLAITPSVGIIPVGNAYKPPAPTNLTGIIDEDGNIQLFWEYSNAFSPYDNSQENVTFEISINGIRTLTSDVKDVLYLVSDRTIDNLTPPLNVTVWAVSSVVGKGSPLVDSVNPTLIPDSIFGTGGEAGLRGITLIYGNYTVQESDNKKAIIGIAQTSFVEYVVTFPVTLSNGFECYVVNSLEGNGLGNRNSFFTIQGVTFLTRTHNNRIKAGESRLFVHVSEGRYFTLGKNDIIYDYQSLTTSGTAFVNVMWGIDATGISLSLPNNPIEGAFVGFRANPNLDFTANPVILSGNGKLIEGITSYTFKRNDERTIFFFTGEQWFYVTQYWYVDVEQRLINSLVAGNNVNIEVTGEGENTAITISASSSINIQDEENDVGSRAVLNFSGSGISASDDAINEKIDIVINDSYYLSRSNHSGTQSHSTISDFDEAVNDRVATLLTEGDNITLVYDDVANTLTINTPTEDIQDRVSQLLVAGNNISIVYNDVANTLTINTPTEDIQDRVASFLIAGNNVTLDYDDTANTLTVNTPTEDIQDRVSEFLVAGENISIFYNDESNSLTISSTAGVGGGLNHEIVNTSFVAVANTIYSVVANSSIICTLPPSPTEGDKVIIVDGDGNNYNSPTGFGLHTCTILGNGNTIQGQSNIVLNTENSSVELIYSGTRWNYVSRNYNFSNEHFYEVIDDRVSSLLVSGSNISLDYSDVANTLTVSVSGLATVATTGNYDDLTNKPIIPSGEFIDDRVASLLTAGSNISLDYDDTANTLTINNTGGGLTAENVDDRVASLLTAGSNISLDYDDTANTLTISANTDTLPVSVSNTYTLQSSDNKKWIKANGTFTISMPSSPPNYYEAIIQNVGTGIITIGGIVNAVGTKLTTRWTACHVYYDGSSWTAVGALTV